MSSEPTVRSASAADRTAVIGVLARAFDDDPIVRWAFRTPQARERWLPAFFGWSYDLLLRQGLTATTTRRDGAALWAAAGSYPPPLGDQLRLVRATWRGVRRPVTTIRGLQRIEHHYPAGRPHHYLAVLGVDPDRQGEGVGTALLTPGLDRCDADGIPAYLETAKESNVGFYEAHGFVVTGTLTLPRGGPGVWLMWRDPR